MLLDTTVATDSELAVWAVGCLPNNKGCISISQFTAQPAYPQKTDMTPHLAGGSICEQLCFAEDDYAKKLHIKGTAERKVVDMVTFLGCPGSLGTGGAGGLGRGCLGATPSPGERAYLHWGGWAPLGLLSGHSFVGWTGSCLGGQVAPRGYSRTCGGLHSSVGDWVWSRSPLGGGQLWMLWSPFQGPEVLLCMDPKLSRPAWVQ